MSRDYAQEGYPYGIHAEYTSQSPESADVNFRKSPNTGSSVDVRGNAVLKPRAIPTQAEADAVKAGR